MVSQDTRTPFAPATATVTVFPAERRLRAFGRDDRVIVSHLGRALVYESPAALQAAFREAEASAAGDEEGARRRAVDRLVAEATELANAAAEKLAMADRLLRLVGMAGVTAAALAAWLLLAAAL